MKAISRPDIPRFDEIEVLHQEIGRLPEKYRDAVILCHLEGCTHAEAARILKCPSGTVSIRVSRAKDAAARPLDPPRPGVCLGHSRLIGVHGTGGRSHSPGAHRVHHPGGDACRGNQHTDCRNRSGRSLSIDSRSSENDDLAKNHHRHRPGLHDGLGRLGNCPLRHVSARGKYQPAQAAANPGQDQPVQKNRLPRKTHRRRAKNASTI